MLLEVPFGDRKFKVVQASILKVLQVMLKHLEILPGCGGVALLHWDTPESIESGSRPSFARSDPCRNREPSDFQSVLATERGYWELFFSPMGAHLSHQILTYSTCKMQRHQGHWHLPKLLPRAGSSQGGLAVLAFFVRDVGRETHRDSNSIASSLSAAPKSNVIPTI